ncbi:serine-rich adhesin for platelets isoform X2 [Drosophila suzukii]|uniref:Serine-rich adhesin for platelets isoform X2 n=1 Tax=Drosophila suzukii TaxID=28584 RepID=A0AB39YY62_DROSZ
MESQKRPSLHLLTDVPAGSAAGGAGPAGSGSGAAAEMSPTSGFLPDMPQWKKDLIQRRKTNVARTQAASIASPTDGSCGALAVEATTAPGAIADSTEPATINSTSQKRNMIGSEEKSEKSSISNTNSNSTGGHHSVVAVSLSPDAAATTNVTVTPIPKQRSSLLLNTRSQEKETEREILGESVERERETESGEREQPAVVVMVSSGRCGEVETGTIGAAATSSSSSSANQNPNQNHLKTKCKPGQSVAEGKPSAKETTTTTTNTNISNTNSIDNNKSCSKTKSISDKLQSNKFIIQQQQQQQQQHQQQLSPTKVTVKPTMVAMQEMKKTTKQNGQHRHLAGKIGSGPGTGGDVDTPNPIPDSLDTGEDLSYGPGIVSKLRCRYLSLALRESRQQSSKQRLQRSTSLNTLLDRDDDEVDVEEPEVASQVRAKSTPPPILGAKPSPKPNSQLQRPVSLGANGGSSAVNPPLTSDEAQPGVTANGGSGSGNRSRHFKRGNEVMKRARSVEALLCEKSPWNSQRITTAGAAAIPSPPATKATGAATAPSPVTSPTCVTIEDKIHNARERLHSGTDTAPPKRLTSIIDDTERPPPDLVKQTLKMFEASANRRPRAAHRSNGVGGVASKVASYKSIIKDQKQPSSAAVASTPPPPTTGMGFASSTPLRNTPHHVHPDIIPRQVDSPVSALSVLMRRMDLQEPETPERETRDTEATPQSEAPSETERNDRDEGDGDGEGDHDSPNNDDHDDGGGGGDSSDNNEQRDKMGAAAGDKPKPPTESAAGGAQRSFAASTENAHVASGSSSTSTSVRKLNNNINDSSGPAVTKQIGVIRPLFNSQGAGSTPLTSREIEKNRINEMKKSTATEAGAGTGTGAGSGSGSSPTTSLDTVINTKDVASSETDASASPLWTLRKLRNHQSQAAGGGAGGGGSGPSSSHHSTENTSMVFNFSKSTKEVPDYIESDVVIYRRKRELPKPNEPGFVLLGDLSVETSTDTDYDDYSMCPPSPCDVEFENANIVIDGKSSIRQKPKDSSFRVQFNDTLTSTFEYPSEASMIIEDSSYADPFGHVSKHHQMLLAGQMHLLQHQQQLELEQMHQLGLQEQHHHVTVDEIIELPTSTAGHGHGIGLGHGHRAGAAGGGPMLGNLPLDII